MVDIPYYIKWLGWLRWDKVFHEIEEKLDEEGRKKIFPILSLRFLCHAYISYPVIFLIFCDIYIKGNCLAALVIFSWSSLSNAIVSPFGGAYADKKGCKSAIRLGIKLIIGIMALYCIVTLFSGSLGTVSKYLAIILQFLTGIAISIIDGADTELLKRMAREQNLCDDDGDRLEGICNQLKYTGAAFASLIGCSIYFAVTYFAKNQEVIAGTLVFLLTGASLQFLTLRQLNRVPKEPDKEKVKGQDTLRGRFVSALREILANNVLVVWVLIVAVTEGGLLFLIYFFQFRALTSLRDNADGVLLLLLLISILYWLATVLASWGSACFNRWHKRAAKEAKNNNSNTINSKRSTFNILKFRLSAAIVILVITLVGVVAVGLNRIFQGNGQQFQISYKFGLIFLLFFAIYQFLRGFSSPLLKATVDNLAAERSLKNPTTILSFALAIGRPFYFIITLIITKY
jgi:hypothetical protein